MLSGVSLALTPAPLLVAIIVVYALPRGAAAPARIAGLSALTATVALLGLDSAAITGGGRVQASFGSPLPGIDYLLRADLPGMAIAFTSVLAAGLAVLRRGSSRRDIAGLLLCAIGGVGAALAGNAVILFGALEFANLGAFAVLTAPRRRPGRAAMAALFVEHLAALGLLAAAADLQASTGTSDFSALPGGALTIAVATPWALAGTVRLVAPLLSPIRGARGLTAAWAASAAVPTGAVVLLRLREAGGGAVPVADTLLLAGLGATLALGGAAMAARWRGVPVVGGRGLCAAVAGPVIALAGFQGGGASTAVAVGLCAVELAVAASGAWERPGNRGTGRLAGAAAIVTAGGLPVGFGATALVLEMTEVVLLGRSATALLVTLLLAALLAAAAAVSMAATLLAGRVSGDGPGRVAPLAAIAVALSVVGALVPGTVAGGAARLLGGSGVLGSAGASAVVGPAGGWAGGYFAVAALLLGAGALAAMAVGGVTPSSFLQSEPANMKSSSLPLRLGPFRAVRRPMRFVLARAPAVDAWLILQPQLPLIAAGAVLAVLLIH